MPLLPRRSRLFAEGGQLGYESQLGAGLRSTRDVVGKAGDALYQNLPPLITPYIHVKPADLDGIRAVAASQAEENAGNAKTDAMKYFDTALKDAKLSRSQRDQLERSYTDAMQRLEGSLKTDPYFFNKQGNRTMFLEDLRKTVDQGKITGWSNVFVSSEKLRSDGKDYLNVAAYDKTTGRRLYKTLDQATNEFQQDPNANPNEFNVTFRPGKESDAEIEFDKLLGLAQNTTSGYKNIGRNGQPQKSIGVSHLYGNNDEQYVLSEDFESRTTGNRESMQKVFNGLAGYRVPVLDGRGKPKKDANGKTLTRHVRGDWRQFFSQQAQQGLLAERQESLDNQGLLPYDLGTDTKGKERVPGLGQLLTMHPALSGMTRRQLLQQLDQAGNDNKLPLDERNRYRLLAAGLEQNRDAVVDQQITAHLLAKAGVNVRQGTVLEYQKTAAHLPKSQAQLDAKKQESMGSLMQDFKADALGDKTATGYNVLSPEGDPETMVHYGPKGEPLDAKGRPTTKDKAERLPLIKTLTGTNVRAVQALNDRLTDLLLPKTKGENGAVTYLKMNQVDQSVPTYWEGGGVDKNGQQQKTLRPIGGGSLGAMPLANRFNITGYTGDVVYLPGGNNAAALRNEPAEKQARLNRAETERQRLVEAHDKSLIDDKNFMQRMAVVHNDYVALGYRPFARVTAEAHEQDIKAAGQHRSGGVPFRGTDQDKNAGLFGHYETSADGKRNPVRFDSFGDKYLANNEDKLRGMGWTRSGNSELTAEEKARLGYSDSLGNDNIYEGTFLVPLTNIWLNEESKGSTAAAARDQQSKSLEQQALTERSYTPGSGAWGSLLPQGKPAGGR